MSERAPLLDGLEGGIGIRRIFTGVWRTVSTNSFWRRTADGLALVVGGVGFASSMHLLASPTAAGSICRPPDANVFQLLFVVFPVAVIAMATVLSDTLRRAVGGVPSRIAALLHHSLAALVMGWMALCVGDLPGWACVAVAVLLLAGAGTIWFLGSDEDNEA